MLINNNKVSNNYNSGNNKGGNSVKVGANQVLQLPAAPNAIPPTTHLIQHQQNYTMIRSSSMTAGSGGHNNQSIGGLPVPTASIAAA